MKKSKFFNKVISMLLFIVLLIAMDTPVYAVKPPSTTVSLKIISETHITVPLDDPVFSLTAEGPNVAKITWSIPSGLTKVNNTYDRKAVTATVTYAINDASAGDINKYVITADDGKLTDTIEITVTVAEPVEPPVNTAPELSAISDKTIEAGQKLDFTAEAADDGLPDDALNYSLEGTVPEGASITAEGYFSWTPTEAQINESPYAITIVVSDGALTDSVTFNVTVTVTVTADELKYLILGDSIATGTVTGNSITDLYGVPSVIDSYVDYFAEYLKDNGETAIKVSDYSNDGDQSSDLLEKLTSEEYLNIQDAIFDADVITISIGGNNLMRAAIDDSSYSGYDFDNVDLSDAELGRAEFVEDWPQIVEALDKLTDGIIDGKVDAKIIVNTVYNPYVVDDPLYSDVVSLLNDDSDTTPGINTVIEDYSGIYSVADVYSSFSAYNQTITDMNKVTYMYTDKVIQILWIVVELRNPHPTAYGQSLIFDAVVAEYEK